MAYTLYPNPLLSYPLNLAVRGPTGPYTRTLANAGAFTVTDPGEAELLVSSFPEVSYRPNYPSIILGETGLLGYWPLDGSLGLTDLSPGAHPGTAQGAVAIGTAAGPNGAANGATDFDGTNDYVSTAWLTRQNLCTNPSAEVDLSTYDISGGTLTRVATWRPSGSWAAQRTSTVTSNDVSMFWPSPGSGYPAAAPGDVISASVQLKIGAANTASGAAPRLLITFDDGSGSFGLGTTQAQLGAWPAPGATASLTANNAVAPAGTTRFRIRMLANTTGSQTVDILWDEILIERAAAVGSYFDGSGYYDAGGAWRAAQADQAWLGTEGLSISAKGPYINGSTRTYEWWGNRDTGAGQTIFGGTGAANNQFNIRQESSTGLRIFAQYGLSPVTWSNVVPATGYYFAQLVFNEAADTAKLAVNGTIISTSALTDPYHASPGALLIGSRSGADQFFDGRLAHAAVYNGDLTARGAAHYAAGLGLAGL